MYHSFADLLFAFSDDNGCISYAVAESIARNCYILGDFVKEYGTKEDWSAGIVTGKQLVGKRMIHNEE